MERALQFGPYGFRGYEFSEVLSGAQVAPTAYLVTVGVPIVVVVNLVVVSEAAAPFQTVIILAHYQWRFLTFLTAY